MFLICIIYLLFKFNLNFFQVIYQKYQFIEFNTFICLRPIDH